MQSTESISEKFNTNAKALNKVVPPTVFRDRKRSRHLPESRGIHGRHLRADGLLNLSSALRPRSWREVEPTVLRALAILVCGIIGGLALAPNTFAESLTLTTPTDPLTLDIMPTDDGQFSKSAPATVSVTTDALAGYTLTVKSKNGSQELTNGGSGKISSISAPVSEGQAGTSFSPNTWGYLPSMLESSSNSDFQPAPNGTAKTIEKTNQANSDVATNYTIKLGAKVDTTIPSGTYYNTFVFTATANPTHYTITYDANGGTDAPKQQTGEVYDADDTVTLSNTQPTRDGYEFKGWCNKNTSNETCSGATYQAGEAYSITGSNTTVTLYAMWVQSYKDLGNLGDMQTFNCSELPTNGNNYGTLKDTRDKNTYKVAKLKDNKCWMIENLKIADKTLTSSDSDVSSSFTLPSSSASGFGDDTDKSVYVDITYGGYYTWIAATAGTGKSATSNGAEATGSICPKGWRLPTKTEFDTLISKYIANHNGAALAATPVPSFKYGGYYLNSSPFSQDSDGYYWSSTAYSSTNANNLLFNSSDANTNHSYRRIGYSVRCVAGE